MSVLDDVLAAVRSAGIAWFLTLVAAVMWVLSDAAGIGSGAMIVSALAGISVARSVYRTDDAARSVLDRPESDEGETSARRSLALNVVFGLLASFGMGWALLWVMEFLVGAGLDRATATESFAIVAVVAIGYLTLRVAGRAIDCVADVYGRRSP